MKDKIKVKEQDNFVLVSVDSAIYSLDSIYDAAYNFLDKAYIHLAGDPDGIVEVRLKAKEKMDKKNLKKLGNEFFNELINTGIRSRIAKDNKKIREYIVSTALIGASKDLQDQIRKEREGVNLNPLMDEDDDWEDDPLGIASSWEDKYEEDKNEKK